MMMRISKKKAKKMQYETTYSIVTKRNIFLQCNAGCCELCFSFDFSLYSQPEFRLKKTKPQASIEQFEVIALF